MKNLHLLPTDKPSRLHFDSELFITPKIQLSKDINSIVEGRNIYITSDEDINENDYIITKDGRLIQVSYLLSKDLEGASKVILTTDQDLIKDGVQAIDDEFLEWFVKNPSCEEVEVEYNEYEMFGNKSKKWIDSHSCYEIIIPKEEPKQETLEEVAIRYSEENFNRDEISMRCSKNSFIDGFKLSQQQGYSEEEVRKISLDFFYHWWNTKGSNTEQGFDKWFEQVKKK